MIIIQVAGIGRSNSISASVVAEDALGLTGRTILKLDHLTKKDHLLNSEVVIFSKNS